MCRMWWPLTLTYIFKVIWPWLWKSCLLCNVFSSRSIIFLTWDPIVWVIMRRRGVSSERRRSSCSSWFSVQKLLYFFAYVCPIQAHSRPKNKRKCKKLMDFYPRPVLAFRYCCWLHLSVCVCVCVCVCHSRGCPCHNSSLLQARITKLGSEVQNTLVEIHIILRGGLTLTFEVKLKVQILLCLVWPQSKCNIVTLSLIGWAHTQNDPWCLLRCHDAVVSYVAQAVGSTVKLLYDHDNEALMPASMHATGKLNGQW